jgi:hypothetical protein
LYICSSLITSIAAAKVGWITISSIKSYYLLNTSQEVLRR